MENIVTTGAVISYAMWSSDPSYGATTPWMLLTLPFVLYEFFAISYSVTQRKLSEEVIQDREELVSDPKKFYQQILPILITVLG